MNSDFHKHHRKRRSQGGDGFWGNMIELPSDVHALVHENPEVAYRHGLLVKSYDDPNQIRPDVRGFLAALGVEGEEKPRRKNYEGEARRKRKRITVAVPADTEDGGAVWDDMLSLVKQKLWDAGLINPEKYKHADKYPAYEALIACMYSWVTDA